MSINLFFNFLSIMRIYWRIKINQVSNYSYHIHCFIICVNNMAFYKQNNLACIVTN